MPLDCLCVTQCYRFPTGSGEPFLILIDVVGRVLRVGHGFDSEQKLFDYHFSRSLIKVTNLLFLYLSMFYGEAIPSTSSCTCDLLTSSLDVSPQPQL